MSGNGARSVNFALTLLRLASELKKITEALDCFINTLQIPNCLVCTRRWDAAKVAKLSHSRHRPAYIKICALICRAALVSSEKDCLK